MALRQHSSNPQSSVQPGTTYEQIMAIAKELIETYGYNGFSYADIATYIGIRKATIHYHFPTKGDLAKSVVSRYRETFCKRLSEIDRQTNNPRLKINMYVQMYSDVVREKNNICMCGMLSAEFPTLPEDVREEVKGFFSDNEKWLTTVIASLRSCQVANAGSLGTTLEEDDAWLLLSGLEGAMLLARTHEGLPRFCSIVRTLLKRLYL